MTRKTYARATENDNSIQVRTQEQANRKKETNRRNRRHKGWKIETKMARSEGKETSRL